MDVEESAPVGEHVQEVPDNTRLPQESETAPAHDGPVVDQIRGGNQPHSPDKERENLDIPTDATEHHGGKDQSGQEKEQNADTKDQDGNFQEDGQEAPGGDPNQDEQQNEDQENWNNYGNQQYQWNGNYQWYPQQGGYYYSGGYGGDGQRRYNDYYYGGPRGGYRGGPPGQPRNNFRRPISPRNSGYGNYRQSQPYHHRYYDDSEDAGGVEGGNDGYRQSRGYQFSRYYNSDRGYQNGDWDEKNNFEQQDAASNDVVSCVIQKDSSTAPSQAIAEKESTRTQGTDEENQQEKPNTPVDAGMVEEKSGSSEVESSAQKETSQAHADSRVEVQSASRVATNPVEAESKKSNSHRHHEQVGNENLRVVESPTESHAHGTSVPGSEDPESKQGDSEHADNAQPSKDTSASNEPTQSNADHTSPPRPDRSNPDHNDPNRSDYSDSYHYSNYSGHYNYTPQAGITKFYVGRILTDTNEEQIRQAFMPFGEVYEVRIIKKAYNGQPLRETYYAFVLIALHKTVKEVTQHFDKNQSPKGWNVSLAKESSRSDDYHSYREGSPTRKRRGDFGSPSQPAVPDANGFPQTGPNLPPNTYSNRGGRGMSSADRNMGPGFGPNRFYRDRWNDGRSDQYPRDNWDPSNGRFVLIHQEDGRDHENMITEGEIQSSVKGTKIMLIKATGTEIEIVIQDSQDQNVIQFCPKRLQQSQSLRRKYHAAICHLLIQKHLLDFSYCRRILYKT